MQRFAVTPDFEKDYRVKVDQSGYDCKEKCHLHPYWIVDLVPIHS